MLGMQLMGQTNKSIDKQTDMATYLLIGLRADLVKIGGGKNFFICIVICQI